MVPTCCLTTLQRVANTTHSAVPDERNAGVLVYINGEFVTRDRARISVFDSGFLVGDGIWEGIRLHRGRFAFLDRHLDRLFHGLETAAIDPGMTRPEVEALLRAVVDRNGMTDGVHVRLMITRGDKKTPSQHPANLVGGPNVVVIAEWKQADPGVRERGIRLATSSVRRPPPDTLDQRLNTHSKIHEVIALVEAVKAGADEALMLDSEGNVATCNATNFFMVADGEVWTSVGHSNLPGITRAVVLEEARAAGIPAHERPFGVSDVYAADEAFVTGTFGGLTPVVEVDGRPIGHGLSGPMTARLRDLYEARVERETTT
jgi:branched-chain amino acid aminotransferase